MNFILLIIFMGIIFIFQAPKIVNREIFRIFTSIYYFKNNTFD